jgi:glycosyltransferase involved in cell wall biosynthesis
MKRLSIIIPTLNEEEGIAKVLCSIPEEIREQSEVIVVDVSTDYTPIIAERLGAKVIRAEKRGKGRQMREAVELSTGEILIFLDGDGTDPPGFIPKLLEKLESADLVLGCRSNKKFEEDDKIMRQIFKVYWPFVGPLFSLIDFNASDPLAGFRAIRRKDWDKLNLTSNAFEIETEINIKAIKQGFTIEEVPIPHLKRCGGTGKSKFARSPEQWLKISKIFLQHFNDETLRLKIKNWEAKLKSKLKIK